MSVQLKISHINRVDNLKFVAKDKTNSIRFDSIRGNSQRHTNQVKRARCFSPIVFEISSTNHHPSHPSQSLSRRCVCALRCLALRAHHSLWVLLR